MRDFDKEINELEQRITQIKEERAKAAAEAKAKAIMEDKIDAKARAAAKKVSDTVDSITGKLLKCLEDVIRAGDYIYSKPELERILPSEKYVKGILSAIVTDTLLDAAIVKQNSWVIK